MLTDNTGSRRIHSHARTHPPTHLQFADKALSWICTEPHLHFWLQKNAYANADKADSNQRAPSPSSSLAPLFFSLPSPLYLRLLVGLVFSRCLS